MKKVLHISNTDISSDSRILKEIHSLSTYLNTEVTVIGVPDNFNFSDISLPNVNYKKIRLFARHLFFLPRSIRYLFEMFEFTIKVLIYSFRYNPNVIHSHDTFSLPAGWISKKIKYSNLIYDAHELESDKNGQNFFLSKATLLIERICWSNIDLLITVSEEIREWYIDNFSSINSIVVLNSPVVESSSHKEGISISSKNYFSDKYNLAVNSNIFIYLGYFSKGRGINICLEAFSKSSSDNHIIFIGSGDLESNIRDYSLRFSNIHIHPAVSHNAVVNMVQNAHWGICFLENVSLSDYYSLPNKIFEYSFAGLNIIASNFPSMKNMIEKYSLGLTCNPDLNSLNQLLSNIDDYERVDKPVDLYELSWGFQEGILIKAYNEFKIEIK
jgi:hypothetical protein